MNHLNFTQAKLNVDELSALAADETCGAISLFVGTTRDNFDGKHVVKLEYEAYEAMGLNVLREICATMREKWPEICNIVIYHRLGEVPVKEASIVIAVSAPHRKDALEATDWCINTVKEKAPIWKKEVYKDSEAEWKENRESLDLNKAPYKPPKIVAPYVPPHLIQVKAANDEINRRIENFMQRKRDEINSNNVRDYCGTNAHKNGEDTNFQCARVDAVLQKRKDSKSHLRVERVLNTFHRDQTNVDYLLKYMPRDGVEERVKNMEVQLSLKTPTPRDIYVRLKRLEDRLLRLESISPEYINFWERAKAPSGGQRHKKVFSLDEIDALIAGLESTIASPKNTQ